MRGNVLDEGADRRRSQRARQHLPRARLGARNRRRNLGLGDRVRLAGRTAETATGAGRHAGPGRRTQVMIGRAISRIAIAAAAGTFALGLAACGERPQVIDYKQGNYQGKPDTAAWAGKPWNGNRQDWNVA